MNQAEIEARSRTITRGLFAAQSLGSAGVIASLTVAAIVGAQFASSPAMAGVPSAVFQLGAALSALPWSLATDRLGRRWGLSLAVAVGTVGAAGSVVAVAMGSFPLLLIALVVMGSGRASFQLSRFTAAEVSPAARRGRAVATVILGGTVGSVVGPMLVTPSGNFTAWIGLGELAGPYLAGTVLFAAGGMLMALFLRPEPKILAARIDEIEDRERGTPSAPARSLAELARDSGVRTAIVVMIGSYAVMVIVMGMTSLHMFDHAHSLGSISLVMSAHTLGMFAFSPVTGRLTDGWGRRRTLALGTIALAAGCLASIPSSALIPMVIALFVLGVGWNLCFIGGSALLSDRLSTAERARTQGLTDLLVGVASAASSVLSGVVYAWAGFGIMSWLGALLSLLLLLMLWNGRTVRRAAVASD